MASPKSAQELMDFWAKLDDDMRKKVAHATGLDDPALVKQAEQFAYGGRQAGKSYMRSVREILGDAYRKIYVDFAKPGGDQTAVCVTQVVNGKIVVEQIAAKDFYKPDEKTSTIGYGLHREEMPPPEASKPAKKLHHNAGFFPNKVGRIDDLPRYPGVWG